MTSAFSRSGACATGLGARTGLRAQLVVAACLLERQAEAIDAVLHGIGAGPAASFLVLKRSGVDCQRQHQRQRQTSSRHI